MHNMEHLFEHGCNRAELLTFPRSTVTLENKTDDSIKAAAAAAAAPGARVCAGARAYARVRSEHEERVKHAMVALGEYYKDTFDRNRVAPAVQQDMYNALMAGMEPEVLMLAMDDAARVEKPTWAYAMAVIRRCIDEDCMDSAAWQRRKAAHAAKPARRSAARQPETAVKDYTQRDWSAYDMGDLRGMMNENHET